ncbi:methyl-accepting chemotaxis protein [Brucepastera parasyntrophica]|uniref:methyl-accepting chemotaxis protein n=1 Tax=Brucepastera parasyntrophica TaxID=2880008 RepID=UPI00210B72EB|nr:methyl-accepting chemotaxis protein [Brucepastera parasyntrophica]
MAVAIFNGLNRKEHCHVYTEHVLEQEQNVIIDSSLQLGNSINSAAGLVSSVQNDLKELQAQSEAQFAAVSQSAASVEEIIASLSNASRIASSKRVQIDRLAQTAATGEREMTNVMSAMETMSKDVSNIGGMLSIIHDVAAKTNLLAMNASIEAAHAGSAGRSFAVVAQEIRKLAETTDKNAGSITGSLDMLVKQIKASGDKTIQTGGDIKAMSEDVSEMANEMSALINSLDEISLGGSEVAEAISYLREISSKVKDFYDSMFTGVTHIFSKINEIEKISNNTRTTIEAFAKE